MWYAFACFSCNEHKVVYLASHRDLIEYCLAVIEQNGYRLRVHLARAKWCLLTRELSTVKAELKHALDLSKDLSESDSRAEGVRNGMVPILKVCTSTREIQHIFYLRANWLQAHEQFLRSNHSACLQMLTSSLRDNNVQEVCHFRVHIASCARVFIQQYAWHGRMSIWTIWAVSTLQWNASVPRHTTSTGQPSPIMRHCGNVHKVGAGLG